MTAGRVAGARGGRKRGRSVAGGIGLLTAILVLPAACDDSGPEGPGTLVARVDAPRTELGSAVVEVRGAGIRGFEAVGDSRVLTRADDGDSHRVLVVDPTGGDLRFHIRIDDVSAGLPSAVVQSAADTTNALVASGVSMTVTRSP